MGKKRKSARSGAVGSQSQQQEGEVTTAAKYDQDETFADSQDEFFTGKDQIMLEEGPSRKRRKQIDEEDRFLEPSDEEVLGYDLDDDNDEDPVESNPDSITNDRSGSEVEDGAQNWGTSKADYYDADIIETEADALEEEAEARRLQQKQLQGMTEADFGFDESEWVQAEDEREGGHGTVLEKLPEVTVTEDTPIAERLEVLKSRYPELEPLSRDYTALQTIYADLQIAAKSASTRAQELSKKRKAGQEEPSLSIAVLKWRALSTYLGSIAMYFAILTAPASGKSEANAPTAPAELRQHPVMQSLLRSRQSWDAVKHLELPEILAFEQESDAPPEKMAINTRPVKVTRAVLDPTLEALQATKKSKKSAENKASTSSSTAVKSKPPTPYPTSTSTTPSLLTTLDTLISSIKSPSLSLSHPPPPPHPTTATPPLTPSELLTKSTRKRNLASTPPNWHKNPTNAHTRHRTRAVTPTYRIKSG